MEKKAHLQFTATAEQKNRIDMLAKKCGLSRSEYLRQVTLGQTPQEPLPAAFYKCCENLSKLTRSSYSEEVNREALTVLMRMQRILHGEVIVPESADNTDPDEEPVPTVSAVLAEKSASEELQEDKPRIRFRWPWERG